MKKHCFIFRMYNIVCADKKSCFPCMNGEWPPPSDITLEKCVIQLHNLAIGLRRIMYKNNSTKEYPATFPLHHSFSKSGSRKTNCLKSRISTLKVAKQVVSFFTENQP